MLQLNSADPFRSQAAYAHTCTHTHMHTQTKSPVSITYSPGLSLTSLAPGVWGKVKKIYWGHKVEVVGGERNQRGWVSLTVNLNTCQRRGLRCFEGKRPIGMLIVNILWQQFSISFFLWDTHKTVICAGNSQLLTTLPLEKRSVVEKSLLPEAVGKIITSTGLNFQKENSG